ncbi:protein MpBHLH22 [Marchantia polymorpha subsp. ruderalis]|uniref:BHLH domain-containing protein n=2 Tax=Marchantia polymorpha TaxID=3197 RepID=A0A176WS33_MARPO|nr:hypothetical protein AXG93_879s1090 [Marchantia polymorpha subsp. ruderalis]PTQ42425.1 hypothetical protein MARPO_0030s0141 [Marchantia polymorpha]BBN20304.1 hypothetical protein Mp_8g18080 [Marchantia polymorpha subsp. ruderalis]|eukprot:PTQ42425.1 hypothetical protein MARPO_0030s0141 [Marchantia polymorpha]
MELSNMSSILEQHKENVDCEMTESLVNLDHYMALSAIQQVSYNCSSLSALVKDHNYSPTSNLESIDVNQLSPDSDNSDYLEPSNMSSSMLMEMQELWPNYGNFSTGLSVQSPQCLAPWEPIFNPAPPQELVSENLVHLTNVSQTVPTLSFDGKMGTSENLLQTGNDVIIQNSSFPTASQANLVGTAIRIPDENRFVRSSTILPAAASLVENRGSNTFPEASDLRPLSKQTRTSPYPSSEEKRAVHLVQLVNANQSKMHTPPSHSAGWKRPQHVYSSLGLDGTSTPSSEMMDSASPFLLPNPKIRGDFSKGTLGQAPCMSGEKGKEATSSSKPTKPPEYLVGNMDGYGNPMAKNNKLKEKTTQKKPDASIKCRSRSRPGVYTNPRSIIEKTRRQRITEKLRELQELVHSVKPDNTVYMLDQVINYVEGLENQIQVLLIQKGEYWNMDFSSMFQSASDESELLKSGSFERG